MLRLFREFSRALEGGMVFGDVLASNAHPYIEWIFGIEELDLGTGPLERHHL